MINKIKSSYEHTIYASYIGYITQAVINNFAPLLFLTFAADYNLTLDKITLLTTVNFLVQLAVDLLSAKLIDKIGYRRAVIVGHFFAGLGLMGLMLFPMIAPDAYVGLLAAVICYAVGGGIMEVVISPLVEACPTKKKEAAMSLLHSFYCWGHVFVVMVSVIFFQVVGIHNWRILACVWAIIPFVNILYFSMVPMYTVDGGNEKLSVRELLEQKTFWLLVVLMICAGASEQAMSQWASAFAESALQVSKTIGDLTGPCAFAFFMGTARAIYGKYSDYIPLKKMMMGSAVLCVACYVMAAFSGNALLALAGCALCGFSVGIFWPGTFSAAAKLLPGGGTAMYALMALAGDLGCSSGPTAVGLVASAAGGNLKAGLGLAVLFPGVLLLGLSALRYEN